jgi:hypothetical protein
MVDTNVFKFEQSNIFQTFSINTKADINSNRIKSTIWVVAQTFNVNLERNIDIELPNFSPSLVNNTNKLDKVFSSTD